MKRIMLAIGLLLLVVVIKEVDDNQVIVRDSDSGDEMRCHDVGTEIRCR